MIHRSLATWAVLVAGVALAGCASRVDLSQPTASAGATPTASAAQATVPEGASPSPATESSIASVDLTRSAAAQAQQDLGRYVYFDFDSYLVRPEFKPLVDGHARRLSTSADGRLVIEGHTDERGGREYNLALGQRRAEAVARSLVLLGAQPQQVEAVSFGEERPKAQGADESAWAQNRRAALVKR